MGNVNNYSVEEILDHLDGLIHHRIPSRKRRKNSFSPR